MRRTIVTILFLASLPASAAVNAVANPVEVLDQTNDVTAAGSRAALVVSASTYHGQVVTPGVSGQLSRVELGVYKGLDFSQPLIVDIVPVTGSTPTFDESLRLARATVDASLIPTATGQPAFSVSVDFSSARIPLVKGEPFAILLRAAAEGSGRAYAWWSDYEPVNDYAGGDVYYNSSGGVIARPFDAQFRTFVLVPEPSAALIAMPCLIWLRALRQIHRTR